MRKTIHSLVLLGLLCANVALGESQPDEEYLGVSDPFGDPSTYEFAEDEKEDKEFFHLGRFLMLGVNIGAGVFTGGLGTTVAPAIAFGGKLIYFFDKRIGFELGGFYSSHVDQIVPDQTQNLELAYDIIGITGGFRYYFDTKSAPRAIAVANPYLAAGGGMYIRRLVQIGGTIQASPSDTSQFGLYVGGGLEFPIYRGNVYLGIDARYHFIFFTSDGLDTQLGLNRGGGLFMPMGTLTYNF